MEMFQSYHVYYCSALGFCVCILFWSLGISLVYLFAICTTLLMGFTLCHFLIQNPNYRNWLQLVYLNFTDNKPKKITIKNDSCQQENLSTSTSTYPWDHLKLNSLLNHELEEFFETLLENYVNFWYTEQISNDVSFILELRQLIRHSTAKIIKTLIEIDLNTTFTDDIIPILFAHIERICRLFNDISPYGNYEFTQMRDSLIEMKILERYEDLHWALHSEENEANYLRGIADSLLCKFVDDIRIGGCFVDEEQRILTRKLAISTSTKWSCHSSRHFLRELLYSAFLIPTIDLIVDPDSLNRLALSLFGKSALDPAGLNTNNYKEVLSENKKQSKFLAKFTEQIYNQTPDSLIAVKLSDLVRDPYLIKLFEIYMRDLNGPINYLDCFLHAREIHMKMQKIHNNSFDYNKKEQYVNEIYSDSWQLFSEYVHTNAPNQIQFEEEMVMEFSKIVESNKNSEAMKHLEHIIEKVYQDVYQHLQFNYVIPFCQSENYLGFLCGAPPDVNELICGSDELSLRKYRKLPDGSFSLSQFRKKLFNFISPTKETISANSVFYPSSSASDLQAREADEFIFNTQFGELNSENSSIALCDLGRDITKWIIFIDGIEQRRGTVAGTYLVFSLIIERNDFPDDYFANHSIDMTEDNKYADYDEKLPKLWTVGHKYEEFYALEDKLREYYGTTLRLSALPDRKTTLQLLRIGRNSRTLMESHRAYFERFLQNLVHQPALKHSELLYAFFTCEEDSNGIFELPEETTEGINFLPDLNPIRAMKRVAKERGQNLKPFVLNLLANVLAPPARPVSTISQRQQFIQSYLYESRISPQLSAKNISIDDKTPLVQQNIGHQRSMSISSLSNGSNGNHKDTIIQKSPKSHSKPLNIPVGHQLTTNSSVNFDKFYWNRNLCDMILIFLTNIHFLRMPSWFEALLCSLNSFIGNILSFILRKKVKEVTEENLFTTEMAVYIVRSLHEFILFSNRTNASLSATPSQVSLASSAFSSNNRYARKSLKQEQVIHKAPYVLISDQERLLRAELLLHCLKEKAKEIFPCFILMACKIGVGEGKTNHSIESAIQQLFHCFQMPKLNRQLAFVLLDIIVQKILIDPQKKNT